MENYKSKYTGKEIEEKIDSINNFTNDDKINLNKLIEQRVTIEEIKNGTATSYKGSIRRDAQSGEIQLCYINGAKTTIKTLITDDYLIDKISASIYRNSTIFPTNFASLQYKIPNDIFNVNISDSQGDIEKSIPTISYLEDNYIAKDEGKGLSSNDYTDEDKEYVGLIPIISNDVNTISSNYGTLSSSLIQVSNRVTNLSDKIPTQYVKNIILNNDVNTSTNVVLTKELYSDLLGGTDTNNIILPYATTSRAGVMTASDKNKLDSLDTTNKQLSTEDFTTLLKEKLDGLTNYDDTELTTQLNALKSRLDTILDSENTTAVIDTFQEIEAFLQGITNTQTLTGLLQEMKGEIVQLCADIYLPIAKGARYANNQGEDYIRMILNSTLAQIAHNKYIECWSSGIGYYNYSIGNLTSDSIIKRGGTSSQFLKADGSVDDNSYWHEGNDGDGSGLDADKLDGKQPADLNVGSANFLQGVDTYDVAPTPSDVENYKCKLFKYKDSNWRTSLVIGNTSTEWMNWELSFNNFGKLQLRYGSESFGDWRDIAFTDSNVASANKLTTKQLTNEDLNEIKDSNYSIYYATSDSNCANIPSDVVAFNLQVLRSAASIRVQILTSSQGVIYKRYYTGSTWTPWKKMLTEDDVTKIVKVTSLPTNPDSNTLYCIAE